MAVRKITLKGDPILSAPAAEVAPEELGTEEFRTLISDMVETMYHDNGVGIAAVQVGVAKKTCIVDSADGPVALVNPCITKYSKKQTQEEEGCLSVPGEFGKVWRSKTIHVEAQTTDGKRITFTADDFFARVIQHEVDHLNGILFIDRIAEQKEQK